MTIKTRIFIDTKNATVVHAIEEERSTFRDQQAGNAPTKVITNVSRALLKQGSRQQGNGDEIFNNVMSEGNYVETDADNLIIKAAATNEDLDTLVDHICNNVAQKKGNNRTYLKLLLRSLDRGFDPLATLEIPDENENRDDADELTISVRDIVRKQAFELAKEYDAKYPDWMNRESLSAQFRNSVRISLKKLTKERVSSVALSIHLGAFLLKRKETLAIEATA